MFEIIKRKFERPTLDKEIESILCAMSEYSPDSEEYTKMVTNLEMIHKAKGAIGSSKVPWKEITTGLFTVIGIGMILGYERTDSITSKALGFVMKGRV